jgi:hypothetical protein
MKNNSGLIEYSSILYSELVQFIKVLRAINSKRIHPRKNFEEEMEFLESSVYIYIRTRNQRAKELLSDKFQAAHNLATRLLKYLCFQVFCVDGRISRAAVAGFIAGGSLRVPMGNITDFIRSKETNKLYLPKTSDFAKLLEKSLKTNNIIIQVLDSHQGCAAAEDKAFHRQGSQKDHGLFLDVMRKMEMKTALEDWVDDYNHKHNTSKKIIVVHLSSQPGVSSQNILIGLRSEENIQYAYEHGGFTDEALEYLISRGSIISTKQLLQEEILAGIFKTLKDNFEVSQLNWGKNYDETAFIFWSIIEHLRKQKDLCQFLLEKLIHVIPLLKEDQHKDKLEAHLVILLGCLVNTCFETQRGHTNHREFFGVITREGEVLPFNEEDNADAFVVYTKDPNLQASFLLQLGLMRKNRISITHHYYEEKSKTDKQASDRYQKAPAIFFVHEVIEQNISWRELLDIDWTDLNQTDWTSMPTSDFLRYLAEKQISSVLVHSLERLRQTMVTLYNPDHISSRFATEGDVIFVPVITDKNREVKAIIPFALSGYSRD